jgi:hypothetical protein
MMDEQDFVTDDETDEMFGDGQGAPQQQAPQQQAPHRAPVAAQPHGMQPMGNMGGLPVYSLALAQVPALAPVGGENLLTRKFGPLPVWGWALTAIGTGIGGYFLWQSQKKVSKNDGDEDERSATPALPESTQGAGSWGPSRGQFADQLNKLFTRKGMAEKVKVFDDADEAKASGKLKHLSPLINIKCEVAYKPDKDFLRLCKRDGLNPIVHEDGTIGLYPAASGKRGQEWEKYIDLLRDDGQKV